MRCWKVSLIALVGLCGCGGKPAAQDNVAGSGAAAEAEAGVRQGIGEFANNAADAELDAAWKQVLLPDSAYPTPEAPMPTISDADRPTSIDAFASQFVRLYQGGFYAPFIELADWGSSTNEQKQEYLSGLRPIFTANATHEAAQWVTTEVVPVAEFQSQDYYPRKGNASLVLHPEPTHYLFVTAYFYPPKTDGATQAATATAAGDDSDEAGSDEADGEEGMQEEAKLSMAAAFAVGVRDGKYYFCTVKHD